MVTMKSKDKIKDNPSTWSLRSIAQGEKEKVYLELAEGIKDEMRSRGNNNIVHNQNIF